MAVMNYQTGETVSTLEWARKQLEAQPPTQEQKRRMDTVKGAAVALLTAIAEQMPVNTVQNRIAVLKVREAVMLANAGICGVGE